MNDVFLRMVRIEKHRGKLRIMDAAETSSQEFDPREQQLSDGSEEDRQRDIFLSLLVYIFYVYAHTHPTALL